VPERDGDREVPRRDAADDAAGLAPHVGVLVRNLRGYHVARRVAGVARGPLDHVPRLGDVCFPLADLLATLLGHYFAEFLVSVFELLVDVPEILGAVDAGERPHSSSTASAVAAASPRRPRESRAGTRRASRRWLGWCSRRSRLRDRRPTRRRCSVGTSSNEGGGGTVKKIHLLWAVSTPRVLVLAGSSRLSESRLPLRMLPSRSRRSAPPSRRRGRGGSGRRRGSPGPAAARRRHCRRPRHPRRCSSRAPR